MSTRSRPPTQPTCSPPVGISVMGHAYRTHMTMTRRYSALFLICMMAVTTARAQGDPSRLTLQRIFASRDFFGQHFGPARWLASGDAYTTLELAIGGGTDIVRYDAASGARTVLVPAARLVPNGASESIDVEDYSWSPDGK